MARLGISALLLSLFPSFLHADGILDPIAAGDRIRLYDSYGSTAGGEFTLVKGTYSYQTFCLEFNEYFVPGREYLVAAVNTATVSGGVSGGNPDPLDPRTAYLYTEFRNGTLAGYDYGDASLRVKDADELQWVMWVLEGEQSLSSLQLSAHSQAKAWYDEAVGAGWSDLGNVRVLNIVDPRTGAHQQDQLVLVPEPATVLLLGGGLVGLAALGRRRGKKA